MRLLRQRAGLAAATRWRWPAGKAAPAIRRRFFRRAELSASTALLQLQRPLLFDTFAETDDDIVCDTEPGKKPGAPGRLDAGIGLRIAPSAPSASAFHHQFGSSRFHQDAQQRALAAQPLLPTTVTNWPAGSPAG